MGWYQEHCVYLPAMLGWFSFSALISSYNKYVFGESHMAFPCPLLMTSIHFLVQWTVSYAASTLHPCYFGGDQVQAMSWRKFLSISIPCGLVTSGDVGLSNLALVRISLTFYTMVKASAPIFVVASAYLFGIEKITGTLLVVVAVISCGEFLTVYGEAEFDLVGFALCLGASVVTGMRWTVIQLKIQRLEPPLKSTIATMRILSPSMFATMLLVSLALERPWDKLGAGDVGAKYFATAEDGFKTLGLALTGAFLAIAMVLCEFYLIMKSNAIVLMIGGVIKEMITIAVGVLAFGDQLNGINLAGFFTVFGGVIIYKISFHLARLERKAAEEGGGGGSEGGGGGRKNVNYAPVEFENGDVKQKNSFTISRDDATLSEGDLGGGGGGGVDEIFHDETGGDDDDDDETEALDSGIEDGVGLAAGGPLGIADGNKGVGCIRKGGLGGIISRRLHKDETGDFEQPNGNIV